MHRGYTTPLVIAIMAFAIVSFLFLIDTAIMPANSNQTTNRTANKNADNVACTLEAKICPDGSAVGRTGPDCDFSACPTVNTNSTVDSRGVQWKSYANSKNGLTFEYPATDTVLREYEDIFEVRVVFASDQDKDKPRYTDGPAGPGSIGVGRYDTLKTDLTAFAREQSGNSATTTNTTVAGQAAVRAEWILPLDPGQDEIDCYYFNYAGKTWFARFDLTGIDGGAHNEFTRLVKSISFDPTAGWKTYTNKEHNFSFKYPPTWSATASSYDPQVAVVTPADAASKTSIELAPTLTVSPVLKIDSSDCVHTEVSSAVSQVTVGTKPVTRTMSGCLASYINTYIPQATPLTGYYVFSWPEVFQDNYPEYETILSTFTYPD